MEMPVRGKPPRGHVEVRLPAYLIPDNTLVFKPTGTYCYRLMEKVRIYNANGRPTNICPNTDDGCFLIPINPLASPHINEVEKHCDLLAVLPERTAFELSKQTNRAVKVPMEELRAMIAHAEPGTFVHTRLDRLIREHLANEKATAGDDSDSGNAGRGCCGCCRCD